MNVKGLMAKSKRISLNNFLSKRKIHTALLQEVHGSNKVSGRWLGDFGFRQGIFSFFRQNSRGAGVISNDDSFKNITFDDPLGRLALGEVTLGDRRIGVISIYAPNLTRTDAAREHYLDFIIQIEIAV